MPRYDYKCTHGHTFEEIVSFGAENPYCPECQGETERQFPVGVGFRMNADPYERDYREMEANGEFDI